MTTEPCATAAEHLCPDGVACPHPKACWGETVCIRVESGEYAKPPLKGEEHADGE